MPHPLENALIEAAEECERLRWLLEDAASHLGVFIDTVEEQRGMYSQKTARTVLRNIRDALNKEATKGASNGKPQ